MASSGQRPGHVKQEPVVYWGPCQRCGGTGQVQVPSPEELQAQEDAKYAQAVTHGMSVAKMYIRSFRTVSNIARLHSELYFACQIGGLLPPEMTDCPTTMMECHTLHNWLLTTAEPDQLMRLQPLYQPVVSAWSLTICCKQEHLIEHILLKHEPFCSELRQQGVDSSLRTSLLTISAFRKQAGRIMVDFLKNEDTVRPSPGNKSSNFLQFIEHCVSLQLQLMPILKGSAHPILHKIADTLDIYQPVMHDLDAPVVKQEPTE